MLRGDVHGFTKVPGTNVPRKRAGRLYIHYCIFSGVSFGLVCCEHDIRRVESKVVELAVLLLAVMETLVDELRIGSYL